MLRSFLKSIIPATGLQQQCMKNSSLVLKEIQDTWGKKKGYLTSETSFLWLKTSCSLIKVLSGNFRIKIILAQVGEEIKA